MVNYNSLVEQVNWLKKENMELEQKLTEKKITEHKRKHNEIKDCDKTQCFTTINNSPEDKSKITNTNQINKYRIKKYYSNSKSWSDEKINDYLQNLTCLKDIVKLKTEWHNIKHNDKLQKLCNIAHPVEKLDKMIGLEEVKKEIFKIIVYYIQNPHIDEYLHTVITGPPGVGKSQVAKIYSNIFVRLGILKSDKFVEIKRDDLVGKYLGHTSHRTKELLESAMGGVVFLDEGYSLGSEEKRDSFAKEAIDMINQYLSERKKDFMFVIAGYEEDLEKCFFSFNRGLKRRFSHWIEISKYSKDELKMIFESKITDYGYQLSHELNSKNLIDFFEKNYLKFENYAGDIEKFINHIKYEQSFRTFKTNTQNKIICLEDMNLSISRFKNKPYEPPLGLYI
jgi:SpoVK/Ycf46/Vps4 family AAA+-type ATPase